MPNWQMCLDIVDAVSILMNATVARSSAPRTAKTSASTGRALSHVQLAVATTPVTLRDARPKVMMMTANSANLRVASASFLNARKLSKNLPMPCPLVSRLCAFGNPEDQQRAKDSQREADHVADELLPCALAFLRSALVLMQKQLKKQRVGQTSISMQKKLDQHFAVYQV